MVVSGIHWVAAALSVWAEPHREGSFCCPVPGPRAPPPPTPQGKGMHGLMMCRKSDKPHSHPSASIGQHWASESPAHSQPPAPDKACGNIVSAFTHVPFAWEHAALCCCCCCCCLRSSTSPVTSAEVAGVSARQDTEQEG